MMPQRFKGWKPPLEKVEQANIKRLLATLGAQVYTVGTRRPRSTRCGLCGARVPESQTTRQSPGLPDILAFLKRPDGAPGRICIVIETKRHGGRMTPDQQVFEAVCGEAELPHITGSLDDVIQWLIAHGHLKGDQVGHYHQRRKSDVRL